MSFNVADIASAGDEFYAGVGEIVAEEEKVKPVKGAGTGLRDEADLELSKKVVSAPIK